MVAVLVAVSPITVLGRTVVQVAVLVLVWVLTEVINPGLVELQVKVLLAVAWRST
jgi:hypothetical protein